MSEEIEPKQKRPIKDKRDPSKRPTDSLEKCVIANPEEKRPTKEAW